MKSKTLLLTCVLMLAIAGVVTAQMPDTTAPAPGTTTFLATANTEISVSGTVVSWTSTELVIDKGAGQHMTFALDPKVLPATTFTAGERVTVRYHSLSGGTVYQVSNVAVDTQPRVAEIQPKAEPRNYETTTSADLQLPETASGLPLLGLLGLLAMGGALAVCVARP